MKTAKRSVSIMLLLAMLLSAAACSEADTESNTDPAVQEENAAANEENPEEAEPEVDELADNLPETDLAGYEFRIASYKPGCNDMIFMDNVTGNPVDDAVYEKIIATEERFNCDISLKEYGDDGDVPNISNFVQAGDDAFDLTFGHDLSLAGLSLQGRFLNINDLPYLDYSKPWWPEQTVQSLTVNGAMYLFTNEISYSRIANTRVWFFNKDRFTDMGLEYPYNMVYEGTWTLDAMHDLLADSYLDVNGNGRSDPTEDRYGIINPYYYCFLEPFNKEPYRHTEDGGLEYVFDVEFYSTLVEKFAKMFYSNYTCRMNDWQKAQSIFLAGNVLMFYETIGFTTSLSSSEVKYGVLPMPKLNEAQSEYYAGCTDYVKAVPITAAAHTNQIALIIESLSADGYRKVYPAYFEKALKSRYADQTDDAKMFDIIMGNDILAISYLYGSGSPYNAMMGTLFGGATANTDIASYAAKSEKGQKQRVEQIMEGFNNLLENQK